MSQGQYIDLMPDDQLGDFLKTALKKKYPDFLDLLASQEKWEEIFTEEQKIKGIPPAIVTDRLRRACRILQKLTLTKTEIDRLGEDKRFKDIIESTVFQLEEQYSKNFSKKYAEEIRKEKEKATQQKKELQTLHDQQKAELLEEIKQLTHTREQLKKSVGKLQQTNQEEQEKQETLLQLMQDNQQRLTQDFRIIREVLQLTGTPTEKNLLPPKQRQQRQPQRQKPPHIPSKN